MPKPIDLSGGRRVGPDLDMEDEDEEEDEELGRPLVRNPVLFDAGSEQRPARVFTDMPLAAEAIRERDVEDVWAEVG
jgi:hypothetical protein